MRQKMKFKKLCFLFFSSLFFTGAFLTHAVEFHIQFKPEIRSEPISCRVYLLLDADTGRDPLDGPALQRKQPFFALDVKFVILPFGGHGDGVWKQVIKGIHQSMDETLLRHHPELKLP